MPGLIRQLLQLGEELEFMYHAAEELHAWAAGGLDQSGGSLDPLVLYPHLCLTLICFSP